MEKIIKQTINEINRKYKGGTYQFKHINKHLNDNGLNTPIKKTHNIRVDKK